jgi:uncharacterized protein YjiS (DUF1127 family)
MAGRAFLFVLLRTAPFQRVAGKSMEMTMSTTISLVARTPGVRRRSWPKGPTATLKRWWRSYLKRRMERAAASQLWSLNDRELKDIGLTRSQIMGAVTGQVARDRTFGRYY